MLANDGFLKIKIEKGEMSGKLSKNILNYDCYGILHKYSLIDCISISNLSDILTILIKNH